MIGSLLIFIALILLMTAVVGISGYVIIDFTLEFKNLSNPYYYLGISFTEHTTEDPSMIEQEFVLGLFFVNIIVVFCKEIDA
jgi:hypothetical protein